MAIPIQTPGPILPPVLPQTGGATQASRPGEFAQMFRSSVEEVQAYQNRASEITGKFLSGESEDLHKVALATQQAELSFEMFVQVRNKVVAAYQEIMRMQI